MRCLHGVLDSGPNFRPNGQIGPILMAQSEYPVLLLSSWMLGMSLVAYMQVPTDVRGLTFNRSPQQVATVLCL